jgi:hypothetical protein
MAVTRDYMSSVVKREVLEHGRVRDGRVVLRATHNGIVQKRIQVVEV